MDNIATRGPYEINFTQKTVRQSLGRHQNNTEYHYFVNSEMYDDPLAVCKLFELAFSAGSNATANSIKKILNI